MTAYLRWLWLPMFATGLLLAGPASAVRADVRDDGNYFSNATIDKANEIIRDIRKDTSKDVVVETFADAGSRKDALKGSSGKKTLQEWAAERARDLKVNGVFILLCKDPPRIQVEAGAETRQKAFTTADTEKLFGILRDHFKDKKFDEGLIAGLRFTQDRMKENLRGVKISAPAAAEDFISDKGNYFSDSAKRKAADVVSDIHKRWNKEVIVETFARKPDNEPNMAEWAKRRARERRVNGVYILACREPRGLQVDVGEETRRKAFTLSDDEKLYERMRKDFSAGKFDDGLVSGVEFIRDTMKKNVGSSPAVAPSPVPHTETNTHRGGTTMHGGGFPWLSLLCPALVIIGVIWLVIGLIRAFTSRSYGPGPGGPGPGYGAPGYGGGGGGGGFMTGLLGGMFGAMAGSWIYNNMFGGSHGSSFGSSTAYGNTPSAGDSGGTLPSDEGRDFAGTGGSYGDDSGGGAGGDYGGDSGGGAGGDYGDDSGGGSGGDYGGDSGGDYGGGGGDFGGGGDY